MWPPHGRLDRCWDDTSAGQRNAPAGDDIQVTAADQFSCALRQDGNVTCWGNPDDVATSANVGDARMGSGERACGHLDLGLERGDGLVVFGCVGLTGPLRYAIWLTIVRHMALTAAAEATHAAKRIYALLGGKRAARLSRPSMLALHDAAEHRLGVGVVDALEQNLGATREVVLRTISLSARTLARRRLEGSLSPEESDRALRLARIAALAEDVLGGREEALDWLNQPIRSLGGRLPIELLRTDAGASMVADVLGRLEHGVFG